MIKPLPQFVEYISKEVLPKIGDFTLRAMMWAYILRDDWVTFWIIDENKLFYRTLPETESWYLEHHCEKIHYTSPKGKIIYMPYHQIPEYVFDDLMLLSRLTQEALVASKIAKKK